MKILNNANSQVMAILREQPLLDNVNYRLLTNCLVENVDGGKVIRNGLTRSVIWLSDYEFEHMFDLDKYEQFLYLYKFYFLVPDDFEELKIIDEVREHFKPVRDKTWLDHPNSFTILTTSKCNARCSYCYEMHTKKKHHMTEETAYKIVKYITSVAPKNQQLKIHWFGGEPLFNKKVIDIIINGIRQAGFNYYCTFTSNGYLFDEETVQQAKNIWNTQFAQITIDGTESVYNKTKNYIYKNVNPYKKVLYNISNLLNNGIAVSVRMNIDNFNGENLQELVKELHSKFGNHPKLQFYCYPVFENAFYSRTEEERDGVFEKLYALEKVMEELGYYRGDGFRPYLASIQCMADSGGSVMISPDGDLGTCEHCTDYDFWSHIDNPKKKNWDVIKGWEQYEKPIDICQTCPLFGDCIRPSKCEEMSKCDFRYKKWKIRKAKRGLLDFYNKNVKNSSNVPVQNTQVAPVYIEKPEEDISLKSLMKKWLKSKL